MSRIRRLGGGLGSRQKKWLLGATIQPLTRVELLGLSQYVEAMYEGEPSGQQEENPVASAAAEEAPVGKVLEAPRVYGGVAPMARGGMHGADLAPCEDWDTGSMPFGTEEPDLDQLLRSLDESFVTTLLHLIDARSMSDAEVYRRAGLSRQLFSKIRSDEHYRPKKHTAIALALALKLDLGQTQDLIGRAGYTLTNASKFDLVIKWFIGRRNWDLRVINDALYRLDLPVFDLK
ncbi:MAG: hypothetical protein PUD02_02835 [Eggerthellales bacterium]|nr:hypothetical protein [Eggerthellales bacterium]